ncbi:hypothetical protein V6N13_128340 [Hibiscus sabdariffa]
MLLAISIGIFWANNIYIDALCTEERSNAVLTLLTMGLCHHIHLNVSRFGLHVLGIIFSKPLYTLSDMCITAGASGLFLTIIFYMVDGVESLLQAVFHSSKWGTFVFVLLGILFWCLVDVSIGEIAKQSSENRGCYSLQLFLQLKKTQNADQTASQVEQHLASNQLRSSDSAKHLHIQRFTVQAVAGAQKAER